MTFRATLRFGQFSRGSTRRSIGLSALVALGTGAAAACGGAGGELNGRVGEGSGNSLPAPVVTADCETRKAQIEGQTTGVSVSCNPDHTMSLTSVNGLPNHYHYHQAPICLAETQHLDHPIAYTIDGAPVFYGGAPASPERTARGLDGYHAPSGLDVCNAIPLCQRPVRQYRMEGLLNLRA